MTIVPDSCRSSVPVIHGVRVDGRCWPWLADVVPIRGVRRVARSIFDPANGVAQTVHRYARQTTVLQASFSSGHRRIYRRPFGPLRRQYRRRHNSRRDAEWSACVFSRASAARRHERRVRPPQARRRHCRSCNLLARRTWAYRQHRCVTEGSLAFNHRPRRSRPMSACIRVTAEVNELARRTPSGDVPFIRRQSPRQTSARTVGLSAAMATPI